MEFLQSFLQHLFLVCTALALWVQSLFGGTVLQVSTPPPPPVASSVHSFSMTVSTSTATTSPISISKHKKSVPSATTLPTITKAPPPSPTLPAPATTGQNLAVNSEARDAIVNILCTTIAGGYLHPISGSGVIIDPRGVILTNAHVGQFFLLRNYMVQNNIDCTIRTGSPAQPTYTATLLYLPPAWVVANATQITAQEPTGTGENDYAFLLITGTSNGSALPMNFPYVPYSLDTPASGTPVLLAAYPAGFLSGTTIETNLYAASALSTVQTLYSFNGNDVDAMSVGGSVVAQAGSSGGAVVRTQDGQLLGIIATETVASTTAERDLHAITMGHINRSLQASGLGGIDSLLSGDLATIADAFEINIAPTEEQLLVNALQQAQ